MNHYKCSKHIYSGAAPCGKCVIEDSRLQMQAIYKAIPGCIGALTHGNSASQKTLRDEFAMAALTGLLANPNNEYSSNGALIADSYEIADDAMKIREAQS